MPLPLWSTYWPLSSTVCGSSSLIATETSQTIENTPIITARTADSFGTEKYTEACYWEIKIEENKWQANSHIWIYFDESTNAELYVYAGTNRTNQTDAVENGDKVPIGSPVRVRADEGVIVVMKSDGAQQTATGKFSYKLDGMTYTWWEQPWIGKHLWSYYLFLVAFMIGVVFCMVIPGLILLTPVWAILYAIFTAICPCIGCIPCASCCCLVTGGYYGNKRFNCFGKGGRGRKRGRNAGRFGR